MNIMSSEHRAKKLINAPEDIISEAIAGMVGAHPDMLRLEGDTGRAVVALDGPRDDEGVREKGEELAREHFQAVLALTRKGYQA